MVEVHSIHDFDAGDIPYSKPPDQCLDEFDRFIVKQLHFNTQVQEQLNDNSCVIKNLHTVLEKTSNDVRGLVKLFHMVQTQLEQITKVQKDLLAGIPIQSNKQDCGVLTRSGIDW